MRCYKGEEKKINKRREKGDKEGMRKNGIEMVWKRINE